MLVSKFSFSEFRFRIIGLGEHQWRLGEVGALAGGRGGGGGGGAQPGPVPLKRQNKKAV